MWLQVCVDCNPQHDLVKVGHLESRLQTFPPSTGSTRIERWAEDDLHRQQVFLQAFTCLVSLVQWDHSWSDFLDAILVEKNMKNNALLTLIDAFPN